ncbi:MAG TPA: phosphatase PAP2 family protein [Telmatospirillum sp.]|nr:phosphatase PAP2 family protein [Telmatospirillum sp.]
MSLVQRFLLVVVLMVAPIVASHAVETPYLTAEDVPLLDLLPPPPAPDSAAQQADMEAVVAAQAARTDASAEQAKADSLRSVMRFADVLGAGANDQALPVTKALFRQVARETEELTDLAKARYQRPRPFATNAALHPLLVTPSDGSRPTGQSPSYPSGHSAFAAVAGILLAGMVPEQRTAIFVRADTFAHNRLVAGVHFPSDIEAGRIAGTVIANALLHNPRFLADYDRSRTELRHALGLN